MFRASVVILLSLTILLGVIYPVAITAIAQLAFPFQANGSLLIGENGKKYGSLLIGQTFENDKYFWGRPSANTKFSGGSNLAYGSKKMHELLQHRVAVLNEKRVPIDLVTASGSGLDPNISFESAVFQVNRIAKSRKMDRGQLMKLIELSTYEKQFGILGERRVNVLQLNLLLDRKTLNY